MGRRGRQGEAGGRMGKNREEGKGSRVGVQTLNHGSHTPSEQPPEGKVYVECCGLESNHEV